MANKRTIQQVYRRWQTGRSPPTNSPGTPRQGDAPYTGFRRPADTPLASPRPSQIRRYRYVSFGRAPTTRAYNPSYVRIGNDPDSAGAFSTPESSMAPTESQGSYGRMQAFEVDSPLAVPEATGAAFSPALIEFAATGFLIWMYQQVMPKSKPDFVDKALSDFDKWLRKILRLPERHTKVVPHKGICGTPQPKATCHPNFPNSFTHAIGSPIATS